MKTKYKLIKEYPGSPCIGTIKEVETREGRVLTCNTWELYNIYPEFWEEIVPKTYEIQSFKVGNNSYAGKAVNKEGKFTGYYGLPHVSLEKALENWSIYSVKRLSDGEIFTVGDKLHKHGATIKKFIVMNDFLQIISDATHGVVTDNLGWRLENLQKARCPLFITEDDVTIYEENKKSCWVIDTDFNLHPYPYIGFKTFSTKQKAEEYIAKNKVLFVTEDNVKIFEGDTVYYVSSEYNLNIHYVNVYQVCGQHSSVKWFSTKEKAQDFISINKPMYSIKDVEQGLIRSGYHRSFIELVLNNLRTFKK
jgi:hypothetical protein